MLNPEQCWAKAAACWDAARQARYVDVRRLFEEIAEQWTLVAERLTDAQQSWTVLAAQ
jgi:hypothetical protein